LRQQQHTAAGMLIGVRFWTAIFIGNTTQMLPQSILKN